MADHADEAVGGAVDAFERAAEQLVGLAVSIDVGGDEGADAGLVGGLDAADEALLGKGFAKVHEASAAPGAVCCGGRFHNQKLSGRCVNPAQGRVNPKGLSFISISSQISEFPQI